MNTHRRGLTPTILGQGLGLCLRLSLCFCLCFGFVAATAHAEVRLEAPEKIARGDAFLALAISDVPVKTFEFRWLGKSYRAQALREGAGSQAVILLPAPLDEKTTAPELRVTAHGAASRGGARGTKPADASGAQVATGEQHSARLITALYDKARPVQKLTVDKKFVNPPPDQMERIKKDRELVRQALADPLPERHWALPFARPVEGSVSSLFGMKRVFNGEPRSVHRGLDLRGATGTPILALADGRVVLADNLYFAGNAVYINHGEGVFSAYMHLSEIQVKPGDTVQKGQVLGLVGATGRVTGPHLHLSLFVQGQSVDPQPLLAAGREPAPQVKVQGKIQEKVQGKP